MHRPTQQTECRMFQFLSKLESMCRVEQDCTLILTAKLIVTRVGEFPKVTGDVCLMNSPVEELRKGKQLYKDKV
jgi:hypothetical protein